LSKKNVIIGLSGGVDSSTAAYLLQSQGHSVRGLFMKNWEEDDSDQYCSARVDLDDATQAANLLNISLFSRNFASEYWENVFTDFLNEYAAGRTPNPDVICNREIKFKTFLNHAIDLGADCIATGHYARIVKRNDQYLLCKAFDLNKDQSYFLYTLGQKQLAKTLFPLGEINKPEVREIAKQIGLKNHAKKDSTGICFIGERNFKQFLSQYLPAKHGIMITPEGNVIGEHDGLMYYTLGQRQGLGIGGQAGSKGEPWYVVGKDLDNNRLLVAQGHDHPLLFSDNLVAEDCHWVSHAPADIPFQCTAKTRYRQKDQACTITQLDEDVCQVAFDQAQRAVTPGQSCVFYKDDICLGGGIIRSTSNNNQQHSLNGAIV